MTRKMLVDLGRCIGCWTCSMACKIHHELTDDEFRVTVRTHGSGAGIDRPQGQYPDLRMTWQPIYTQSCTFCPERLAEGDLPMCVYDCPTQALAFGDDKDPESDYSKELQRCKDMHYQIFEIPAYEGTRANVTYASR